MLAEDEIDWDDPIVDKQLDYYRMIAAYQKRIDEPPTNDELKKIVQSIPKREGRVGYKYERIPHMYYGLLTFKLRDGTMEYHILDERKRVIKESEDAIGWCICNPGEISADEPLVSILAANLQKYFSRGVL